MLQTNSQTHSLHNLSHDQKSLYMYICKNKCVDLSYFGSRVTYKALKIAPVLVYIVCIVGSELTVGIHAAF